MTARAWLVSLAVLAGCGGGEPPPADPGASPREREATPREPPADEARAEEPPAAVEPPAPDPARAPWHGTIVAYPGARELCYQHVSGTTMHVFWTGWASPDPIERVRAFYERHRGAAILDGAPDAFSLRIEGDPSRSVSVTRVGAGHPSCDVAPEPTDRTYFVVQASTGG